MYLAYNPHQEGDGPFNAVLFRDSEESQMESFLDSHPDWEAVDLNQGEVPQMRPAVGESTAA